MEASLYKKNKNKDKYIISSRVHLSKLKTPRLFFDNLLFSSIKMTINFLPSNFVNYCYVFFKRTILLKSTSVRETIQPSHLKRRTNGDRTHRRTQTEPLSFAFSQTTPSHLQQLDSPDQAVTMDPFVSCKLLQRHQITRIAGWGWAFQTHG